MNRLGAMSLSLALASTSPCVAQDSASSPAPRLEVAVRIGARPSYTYWRARDRSALKVAGSVSVLPAPLLGGIVSVALSPSWTATIDGSWVRTKIRGELNAQLPGYFGPVAATWFIPSSRSSSLDLLVGLETQRRFRQLATVLEAGAGVSRHTFTIFGNDGVVHHPTIRLGWRARPRAGLLARGAIGLQLQATRSTKDLAAVVIRGVFPSHLVLATPAYVVQTLNHDKYWASMLTGYVRWRVW